MKRRTFVALGGTALAAPRALLAQPAKRVYRIAIFDEASEKVRVREYAAFRRRLRELGLVEGSTVIYEIHSSQGETDRLPALAARLVATKPDIILCSGTPSARAAMRVTATIPIVFVASGDPVGTGLVKSLSRPGGNVTGFSASSPEIALKAIELLREMAPGIKRIAYLADPSNPASVTVYSRMEELARKLNMSIQLLDGIGQAALERSFALIGKEQIQALVVSASGGVLEQRNQIVLFAARKKLPVVYTRRDYVDEGGLMSYGIHRIPLYVRSAELVHRILQGAKPGDIPVEQIAVIQMVLNLKTARAQGIRIPDSVRLRADEVIE